MNKKWLVTFLLVLSLIGCQQGGEGGASIQQIEKESRDPDKNVVLVIIDSMTGSLVDNTGERGTVPALEFLMENGQYYKDLVAPFPSMSVVIESSIITGESPENHRIPGLVWYDQREQRIVDYGSTIEKMVKLGMKQALIDSLYHLNNTHLNPHSITIFEELQNRGYTTGAVNTVLYRGNTTHDMNLPPLLDDWLQVNGSIQTKGPDLLAFGTAVKPKVIQSRNLPDGVTQRFGLNDEYSVEVVKELIKNDEQPDFLFVFLPDFDKEAHINSPHYRVGFERAEHYFQEMLNSYESWDKALEENIFIVIGDHGQDKLLADEARMAIDLDAIYGDFIIPDLMDDIIPGDVVLANNHRSAYVYPIDNEDMLPRLGEMAMMDKRISFAAWEEDDWIYVISPDYNDGMRFQPIGPWTDRYDQTWTIEGNRDVLTLQLEEDNQIVKYVDYPDILNQIQSALHSQDTPAVVLNAKPSYTFKSEGAPLHVDGGEHGGAHKNDTLAAMIIAGTDEEPPYLRMADLKEYILQFFEE
ncbi:alkaline phosphatase family protein [Bacillus sp. FJAT-45350]|uniref:alkaline phosphatase family protein n=1 Tax=Bacillus sp. FJAT-45350 TaxID=2011014 RepID=UPI0015CDB3B4|nr:alkaline phosphatase family protein [Bacillus sp. FJAT-45350]